VVLYANKRRCGFDRVEQRRTAGRAGHHQRLSDGLTQHQRVDRSEYHALSKRTGLYALQAFQRTNGNTPGAAGSCYIITATATVGDGFQSAPPSSRSQFAAGVGIVHRFYPAYDRKRKEGLPLRQAFAHSAVRRST
jgi:hypothetical protein